MRDRNDSWREDKGIPCGKGWISKEKKCQIKASGGSGDGIKIATGAGVAIAGIGVAGLASTYFLQKNTVNSDIDTPIELLPDDLKQRRQWYDSEIQRISQEMNGLAASEKAAKSRHKQEQSQQSLDNYSCAYLERRSKGDDAFNLHFNKLADGYDVRNKITPLTSNVDNRGRKMFVARHAEREDYANPNFKPQRRHDSPLSDNGLEQAKEIAKTLKGKGINEIYVSPFLRTVQTANAIAEELDISLKIEPGMAEWHNASWHSKPPQVMTKEELKKLFPRVDLDYESPHRPNYPETSDDVLTRSRNTALDIAKKSKGNALMLGHGPSVIGAARGLDGGSPVVLPQFAGVVEFEGTKTGWANKGISHPSKTKKPAKCSGRGDSMIREDKGIPCGKGWISKEKECRVGRGSRRVKTPDKRNPLNGKLIKQAAVTGGVVSVGAVVAAIAYQQHSSIIKEKEGDRKAAADVYAHFSNRPDLVEKFTLSGKGGNKPWKPEMSAKEAEEWSKDSAFPGSAYHLTSHWAAGKIKEGGFLVPKKAAVGRDHGDGVYLGFNETAKTDLANFYSDLVGKGNNETLEVRTNLRKVLDLGAVKKEAESQGFEFQDKKVGGSFLRPEKTKLLRGIENPETKYGGVDLQLMRIAAASMGKKDDLEKRMAIARKEGHEAPEGIAFGEILQEMGYDGLTSASTEANSLTEKKPHPGILLVFDPKRIAVVKNKGDIGFNKTKQESFELNGRSLKSEPPPQDYSKLTDNLPFKEPPFDYPVKGSARKSGVTIVEPDGRVWMMKVKGNYGGENFSGPRGGSEPGLTDWQNAVKEAREELGLNVKIVDYLGDFDHMKGGKATKNSSAVTRQYVGVRTGGAPWDAASEADFVKLLTLQSAKELTKNNSRGDQPSILKDMESYLSDPNKLTEIQKYYPGYRGDSITPNSRIGIYPVVKNAIASVYGDFDDFPIVHSRSDGNISGVFFDRGQLYDYEITPMGELSYVESSHSDSYLVGFSVDSGWMQQKRGDRAVPLRDRKSSGYKKKNCISGKPCGNACIAKGLKCRVKLGDREVQALRQVQSSLGVINKGKQLVTENRQYLKGLAIAGVTVGAAMAGVGLAAYSIKRDLNQSSVDFNSIRQPPGGIPDEQTLAKYDTFQPGDLVRKNFKSPTMGVRQHYAVYAGKNLETGEHMVIDTGEDYKDRDSAPRVIMRGMTWTGDQPLNDSEWERVPDKDMHLVKGTQKLSQEEILDRANRMLYQKFEYQGFTSNCEAFARGIVEGKAYSQQGMKVSPLTNFTSRIVTNNALKLRTGIEGQMKLHEATAEKLIKEGRPPDDPQVIAARNAANSFKTKLEFYGGVGAEKPIVKLGEGREITGLSGYATDQYKMTAQQMVKELKKQKEMDLRRQWDKLPNPYTGQAESGPTKGKIYKPRTIADVAEELNVSLDPNYKPPTKQQPKKWEKGLNDIRGFFRQGQKTDADEEEILSADAVDAYLRSLGIRTPSEYEKAVDAIASEFPSIEESIRVTMFTDYLLVLFAMFSSDNEKT
ncbi:MAG: histidine phosphatase family protein, partial [Halothece sp.]